MPPSSTHPTDAEPITLSDHGWFFVGGQYVERENGTFQTGGMYVEHFAPETVRRPYPVVMIHGGAQTGTNFTATPDGRRGWVHDFLRAGYAVYVVDQPERGRSGHMHGSDGSFPLLRYDTQRVEQRFTAPAASKLWPQAAHHTQWPGDGVKGDPVFDQFFASQVEMLTDRTAIETLTRDAGAALLDRIGPAILLTHSQSGPFGWLIADARPELVKGILSIEPNGPPFYEVDLNGAPDWFAYDHTPARVWGITRAPLTFGPPAASPEELSPAPDETPSEDGFVQGYLQGGPARTLPRLQGIPILIATAEASYHATYDHCTSRFLTQAGVEHDFLRLADRGIHGNGHMVMLEQNNHEIADLLIGWLAEREKV
jgi:pimeloyl-ACP methyl ester carboxylesterase